MDKKDIRKIAEEAHAEIIGLLEKRFPSGIPEALKRSLDADFYCGIFETGFLAGQSGRVFQTTLKEKAEMRADLIAAENAELRAQLEDLKTELADGSVAERQRLRGRYEFWFKEAVKARGEVEILKKELENRK